MARLLLVKHADCNTQLREKRSLWIWLYDSHGNEWSTGRQNLMTTRCCFAGFLNYLCYYYVKLLTNYETASFVFLQQSPSAMAPKMTTIDPTTMYDKLCN